MEEFSERLHQAMELRGVTQRYIAEGIGTTEATISRYVSGKATPAVIKNIRDTSKLLNVSSDFLLGLTNIHTSKETMTDEERVFLSIWSKITDYDKKVIWALLDKYLSPRDKELLHLEQTGE